MKIKNLLEANGSKTDTLEMTIPFFIRCLEWAMEECNNDVELHSFAEKLISKNKLLDMSDYKDNK